MQRESLRAFPFSYSGNFHFCAGFWEDISYNSIDSVKNEGGFAMANFCKKCGAPLNPTSKFCTKCGAQIADTQPQQVPVQPQRPIQQPIQQPYQQQYQPPYQAPAKSQSDNPMIIGLLVLVVVLLGGLVGYYLYSNTANDSQATYSKIEKQAPENSSGAEKEKPAAAPAGANLDELVREKDSIDTAIGELANRINSHLSNHSSFRGYDGLKNDAKAIIDRANSAKDRLNGMNAADNAKKEALMNLFSLEIDRAHGLYKGIVDNQNGGDYSLGFQQGTKASYAFDAANSTFNATYK